MFETLISHGSLYIWLYFLKLCSFASLFSQVSNTDDKEFAV